MNSYKLGTIGLVIGAVALGAAILHFWLGPLNEPPPLEQVVAEKALKIRDAVVAGFRGEKSEVSTMRERWDADRLLGAGIAMAGFVAILLGVAAFVKREDLRVSGSAAALGTAAIAFQFAIIAVGAIIVAILVAVILSQLDLGIG